MRGNDYLGELRDRFQASLRRRLSPDILTANPQRRVVHDCLQALNPRLLSRIPVAQTRFVVIDTETTGLHAYAGDEIVSIALIELHGTEPTGRAFNTLVNPARPIPPASTAIHHITDADVAKAPRLDDILPDVVHFMGESVLVGHHVSFDIRFLNKTLQRQCLCRLRHPWLDTMMLYVAVSGRLGHYALEDVAQFCQVEIQGRHTAYGDAVTTAAMFKQLALRMRGSQYPVSQMIKRQTEIGLC